MKKTSKSEKAKREKLKKQLEAKNKQLESKKEAMEETKEKMRQIFKQADELEDKKKKVEQKETQVKKEEKKVEKKEEKRGKKAEKVLSKFKPKTGRAYLLTEPTLSKHSLRKFADIVDKGYKGYCFSGSPEEFLFDEDRGGKALESVKNDIGFFWISEKEIKPEKGILTYEFGEIMDYAEENTIIFVELDKLLENTDVSYVLKEIESNSESVVGKPCILFFFVNQNPKHPDKEKAEFISKSHSFVKVKEI
ncbi:MAG: hypothetical protein R6U26_04035 [Candidatus Undinarchaeales archaeon]